MMSQRFVHLRTYSEFSLIKGMMTINQLLTAAAERNMGAIALTDLGTISGWHAFYRGAAKYGIKPILGVEVRLIEEAMLFPLTLLAKNFDAYRAIMQLVSKGYQVGEVRGRCALKKEWLQAAGGDLILLSGGQKGEIGHYLLQGKPEKAWQVAQFYKKYFPDSFFLELHRLDIPDEDLYLRQAADLSRSAALPVVATNPVCFLDASDCYAHQVRMAIQLGCLADDAAVQKASSALEYFRTAEMMSTAFESFSSAALENSIEIAVRCNVRFPPLTYHLPNLPADEVPNPPEFLAKLVSKGIEHRGLDKQILLPNGKLQKSDYLHRAQEELKIISDMGFEGYFLVVWDFVQWSKNHGIPVGPGRGSGAGSLVAYALGITDLDPLRFQLLFERFLNPARIALPDFDIDFCVEKRDQVLEYVIERYGKDQVAQIATFGSMLTRAVVRDVGRALGYPYGFVDRIAKLIPFDLNITLTEALNDSILLKQAYEQEPEVTHLLNLAKKLEGLSRSVGRHAGGVVIASKPVTNFSALYYDESGCNPTTQFDKDDLEKLGLVKFDFLGLRTLTVLHDAVSAINVFKKECGLSERLSLESIPLDDRRVFELLKTGGTIAVFQLESAGMRGLIQRLQPDNFEEIIALTAMFRPGPLQSGMVDNFIARKLGKEAIAYPEAQNQHPILEPILKETYGIILYQEQAMQIAQAVAGFTLAEADLLRQAIGKKNAVEMAKQRDRFAKGSVSRGFNSKFATHLFDIIEKFSGYAFNKSHSCAYALIAYQTLYLKAHYPSFFMAAVLSSEMEHIEKLPGLIDEVRRLGIVILPPDIRKSGFKFTVNEKNALLYGLGAIRGVGKQATEKFIALREAQQDFFSLSDCLQALVECYSKTAIEHFVAAGALDTFGIEREWLVEKLPLLLQAAQQQRSASVSKQTELFAYKREKSDFTRILGAPSNANHIITIGKQLKRLAREQEVLGFYFSGTPLHVYQNRLERLSLWAQSQWKAVKEQEMHSQVAVELLKVRFVRNKQGNLMALLTCNAGAHHLDAVWSKPLTEQMDALLQPGQCLVLFGKVQKDFGTSRFKMRIVDKIMAFLTYEAQQVRSVILGVSRKAIGIDAYPFIERLGQALEKVGSHGSTTRPLYLSVAYHDGQIARWRLPTMDGTALLGLKTYEQVVEAVADLCPLDVQILYRCESEEG